MAQAEERSKKEKGMRLTKLVVGLAAIVMIFSLGFSVGRGNVTFGNSKLQSSVSKNLPANLDYGQVEQLYDTLRKNFDGQLSQQKLLEGMKQGLAKAAGDTYTEYFNAKEAKAFDEDLNGTFSGIGAELSKENKSIVVVSPIEGFPAAKAGLRPKDVIAEINGKSAYDLGLAEAVNKIRGPVGTKVTLKIIRDSSQELDLEITRAQITIPSVESDILDGNIGYLKITRFAEDTSGLATQAADKFQKAGVKSVILDVRNDPGGLLDAAVHVAGLWLPSGKTVLAEKRDGITADTLNSSGPATLQGLPTIVLVNEGSASASEILAGALKDNGAATLMGVKTFGKGSVQQLENLPDGGVLKVTIARWYTPGGVNIDKAGIKPDKEVKLSAEDAKNNRDPQKDAAIQALKQ